MRTTRWNGGGWLVSMVLAGCVGRAPLVEPVVADGEVRFAEVLGGRIAFTIDGAERDGAANDPIVLLNGGAIDHRQWNQLVPALARGHRVICFDPRGWGESGPTDRPWSNVEDLCALLDQIGVARAHFVGSSFGGGIALDLALDHPERVQSLALIGADIGGYAHSDAFKARERELVETADVERASGFLIDETFVPSALVDPQLAEFVTELIDADVALFHTDFSRHRRPARPAIDRLESITAPTLVLRPDFDHPDVAAMAELLAHRVPGAKLVHIADSGHLAQLEQPQAVLKALTEWWGAMGRR